MRVNFQVLKSGNDITDTVISLTREASICEGTASIELTVEYKTGITFSPWEEVQVYEDGIRKGIFYVANVEKNSNTGQFVVNAQDGSKKIADYFVSDVVSVTSVTTARYWITRFLNEATVTHVYDTDDYGVYISENTSFGPSGLMDILLGLLQQSGWYLYFDADGVCRIGTLSKDLSSPDLEINDTFIKTYTHDFDDNGLRNRVVVWGNGNSGEGWVFADQSIKTGYERSTLDKRAILLANSGIRTNSTARSLANKLLNEYSEIKPVRTFELIGLQDVVVGDVVLSSSDYFTGSGLVTSISVNISGSGALTTIVLDFQCPRLLAYYGFISHVYTGTEGSGVYRKELATPTWESFSTGLDEYNVTDLIIKNSLFACIAGNHCYFNRGHSVANWQKFEVTTLTANDDTVYTDSDVRAVACDIDQATSYIYIGYRLTEEKILELGYDLSWVVIAKYSKQVVDSYQVTIGESFEDVSITDVEKSSGSKVTAVVEAPASLGVNSDDFWGSRRTYGHNTGDGDSKIISVLPSEDIYEDGVVTGYSYAAGARGRLHTLNEGRTTYMLSDGKFGYCAWTDDEPQTFEIDIEWPDHTGVTVFDRAIYRKKGLDTDGQIRENDERPYEVIEVYKSQETEQVFVSHFVYSALIPGVHPTRTTYASAATTENITLNGIQTVDGVPLQSGDLILVKDQDDPTENGLYNVFFSQWFRITADLAWGQVTRVKYGTVNAGRIFQLSTEEITVGVTDITYEEVLAFSSVNILGLDNESSFSIFTPAMLVNGVFYYTYSGYIEGNLDGAGDGFDTFHTKSVSYNLESGAYRNDDDFTLSVPVSRFERRIVQVMPTPLYMAGTGVCYLFGIYKKYTQATENNSYDYRGSEMTLYCIYLDGETAIVTTKSLYSLEAQDIPCYGGLYAGSGSDPAANNSMNYLHCGYALDGIAYRSNIRIKIYYKLYINCTTSVRDCRCLNLVTKTDEWQDVYLLNLPYLEEVDKVSTQKIVVCLPYPVCSNTTVGYIDPEEAAFNPSRHPQKSFISKNGLQYFLLDGYLLYDGSKINSSMSTSAIASLPSTISTSVLLDDLDNSIYYLDGTYLGKMIPVGGAGDTIAQIELDTSRTGNFIYANQLITGFSRSDGTRSTSFYVDKLKNSIILSGVDLSYLLDKREDGYTIRDFDFFALREEESLPYPITTYTVGSGLFVMTINEEEVNIASNVPPHFKIYNNQFSNVTISGIVSDLRVMNFGGDNTIGGRVSELDYGKYVTWCDDNRLLTHTADAVFSPRTNIADFVGANHIETSNRYYPQYMFATIPELESYPQTFWQKFPYYTTSFVDHSAGMPTSPITVIRLDDGV